MAPLDLVILHAMIFEARPVVATDIQVLLAFRGGQRQAHTDLSENCRAPGDPVEVID